MNNGNRKRAGFNLPSSKRRATFFPRLPVRHRRVAGGLTVVLPLLLLPLLPDHRGYLRNQGFYFGLLPVLPLVVSVEVLALLFLLFLLFFVVVLSEDILPELEPALDEPVWPDEEPVCEPAWAKVNGDTATAKAKVRIVFLILDLLAGFSEPATLMMVM